MEKKRILYIWKSEYPFEIRIKKFLEALVSADFDVLLVARYNNETLKNEKINGIQINRVGNEKNILTSPIPKMPFWKNVTKQAIKDFRPHLIIVREMLIAETVAIVGKRYNIPVVMDMAENYPACMRTFLKYNSSAFSRFLMHKVRLPDIVERRAVGLCDGIVVVCDEQINRLNQQYNYPKDNIAVAQNTPILQDFSTIIPSVVNIQHKMSNNNQINFTSHGYLSAEKPLDNFILGFNKIAERYNINLTIAGMGECFEGLKNLIQSLENRNKIQLTGAYDYSTLPQIINNTDIGVIPFPADDQTNFTIHNKLFEYMIGGKPVLVGNSQPFQRIINETKVGLSMDFSTSELSAIAIEKMLQQDTEQMSKNCLHFIKTKYNWNVDSNALIDFINKMIDTYN